MFWLGVLVVSPLWGTLATRIVLQAWLALAQATIHAIGFVAGRVERKKNAVGMGFGALLCIFWSVLFAVGNWLLSDILHFGYYRAESIVLWIFVGLNFLYMIPQVPGRLVQSWRSAMIPGEWEEDIRRMKLKHPSC